MGCFFIFYFLNLCLDQGLHCSGTSLKAIIMYGGPPAPVPEGMEYCPLTNLPGENVFGDYDFDKGAASPLFDSPPNNNPHASPQQDSKVDVQKKVC